MLDIHDAAQDLIDHHRRRTPSLDFLSVQARFMRRRRRAGGVAIGVAVALLVAASVYRLDGSATSVKVNVTGPASSTTVASTPTTVHYLSAAAAKQVTPSGWSRVNFDDASIAAPTDWTLLAGENECPNPKYAVLLGADTQTGSNCGAQFPAGAPMVSYVRLLAFEGQPPAGKIVEIDGHTGTEVAGPSGTETYYFRDLGLAMTVYGSYGAEIASTVGWSATYLLLHPTGPVSVPANWVEFSYDGVSVRVPPTWPQKTLGPSDPAPGVCANATFTTPVAERGAGGSSSCNGFQPYAPVADVDGVWMSPYVTSPVQAFTPSADNQLRSSPVAVYLLPPRNNGQPIAQLVAVAPDGDMVSIDLGLGADPVIGQEILASIR